ncbi:unnamed protein product, partial [Discosporangium mesarthrocarpum]
GGAGCREGLGQGQASITLERKGTGLVPPLGQRLAKNMGRRAAQMEAVLLGLGRCCHTGLPLQEMLWRWPQVGIVTTKMARLCVHALGSPRPGGPGHGAERAARGQRSSAFAPPIPTPTPPPTPSPVAMLSLSTSSEAGAWAGAVSPSSLAEEEEEGEEVVLLDEVSAEEAEDARVLAKNRFFLTRRERRRRDLIECRQRLLQGKAERDRWEAEHTIKVGNDDMEGRFKRPR